MTIVKEEWVSLFLFLNVEHKQGTVMSMLQDNGIGAQISFAFFFWKSSHSTSDAIWQCQKFCFEDAHQVVRVWRDLRRFLIKSALQKTLMTTFIRYEGRLAFRERGEVFVWNLWNLRGSPRVFCASSSLALTKMCYFKSAPIYTLHFFGSWHRLCLSLRVFFFFKYPDKTL